MIVNGTERIEFRCLRVETEYRYYTESEARELVLSMKSRIAGAEMKAILSQIKDHGVRLSLPE